MSAGEMIFYFLFLPAATAWICGIVGEVEAVLDEFLRWHRAMRGKAAE